MFEQIVSALTMRCLQRWRFRKHLGMESSSVHRKPKYRRGSLCLLLLVPLLGTAAEPATEKYHFRFSGKPSSIVCTETSNTINPGLTISWNLPADTPVHAVVEVGGVKVLDEAQFPPSLSGKLDMAADTTSWTTAMPFPYTVVHSMTPLVSGSESSTLRYDCIKGIGTNFRISNTPAD
jgi:hypothetical protein